MENQIKENIKSLTMIWISILMSYLSLAAIIFYMSTFKSISTDKQLNAIYLYISIISIFALIPAAYFVYGLYSKKGKKTESETEKLNLYRKAFVYRIAFIEFAGILPLMSFYFSKNIQCLFMAAIPIVVFLMCKPSETRFKDDFYEQNSIF